jgi:hypothetical protein
MKLDADRGRGSMTPYPGTFSVALCAFSVPSVSGMDRTRERCVAMSPHIARLLFDTEHTEKAQRATELNDEPLERPHAARKTHSVMEH